MSQDPNCYPGTNVLQNRFGLKDEQELKVAEARVAAIGLYGLRVKPLSGLMDEGRLKATHRALFGELYAWAGEYRKNTGTMTKGRSLGYRVTYGDSAFVPGEMTRIFTELAGRNYLRGLDVQGFAAGLAYFYSEMDGTHPFREGNSRTLRQFTADLAMAAGYEMDWEPTGATQASIHRLYAARDRASMQGDCGPLEGILRENLRPLGV